MDFDTEEQYRSTMKTMVPVLVSQAFVEALSKFRKKSASVSEDVVIEVKATAKLHCNTLFPDLPASAKLVSTVFIKGTMADIAKIPGDNLLRLISTYRNRAEMDLTFGGRAPMDERPSWNSDTARGVYNSAGGSPFRVEVVLSGAE